MFDLGGGVVDRGTMKISVILAHPSVGSFNHALAKMVTEALQERGHEVTCHDLYGEGFDPIYRPEELRKDVVLPPEIEAHCREIEAADGLVIVHPNYWSRPPAMMCGWVDRVLRQGRAYRFVPDGRGGARPEGLLKIRSALVLNTGNTPQEREVQILGDPLEIHWKKVVFGLCGVGHVVRKNFAPVIVSTPETREGWLKEAASIAVDTFR